ncbi:PTS system glucose-specific IIA component [Thermosporothrix hazakensis]|jgi:glucose-specific phosphotransferase system IIA component|uniref:PTS system glucose-specific IIA component n=1 Tax=Thermosporothrix hazakensis TaxID=644383 RepID=A0A326U3S7_THEHA|nr:PTS glucose transporter subunit IIA [Thermosporothrix hazakensis]PZW18284.1 PTS system glucose-specific IIA component [Thermosporothrix hazakensis]GCE49250.1 PTS glucose transporter subunit IIA [Thermosporothrix hazakensis]
MAEIRVLAPIDGTVVELENVPDEVFAQKMAGDGVAIDPSGNTAVAPISGTLVKLFDTGHAFGMATGEGAELIVHIGIDTVELEGEGFSKIATEGQQVQAGTPVVTFNRATIERNGKAAVCPIVSSGVGKVIYRASGTVRAGKDVLFILEV